MMTRYLEPFVAESKTGLNACLRGSMFCKRNFGNNACPFTSENGRICGAESGNETFCMRHDVFLRNNKANAHRKKYHEKVVYIKHEKSSDPNRILKEMIGRCTDLVSRCVYPDDGHQIRLQKLYNMHKKLTTAASSLRQPPSKYQKEKKNHENTKNILPLKAPSN